MLVGRQNCLTISVIGSLWAGAGIASATPIDESTDDQTRSSATSDTQPQTETCCDRPTKAEPLDPVVFFAQLVDRYRRMTAYEDTVSVVQVIDDGRAQPSRVESELACSIDEDGNFDVITPTSDLSQMLHQAFPIRVSDPMQAANQEHAVWLAPHMSLRFDQRPLQRSSHAPVKPIEARTTRIEDHTVVQLRLSNRVAEELSVVPACRELSNTDATFDLFVNPDSMLIERIESDEMLPDGRQQKTTVHIQPLRSVSDDADHGRWVEAGAIEAESDETSIPASTDANITPPDEESDVTGFDSMSGEQATGAESPPSDG